MASSRDPTFSSAISELLETLRQQLADAKEAKEHKKAQDVRQKIWMLEDHLHLGKLGPGAPDLSIFPELAKSLQPKQEIQTEPTSRLSDLEKDLRRLKKKLKGIEQIKERIAKGINVEKNQMTKIEREECIRDEILELEEIIASLS